MPLAQRKASVWPVALVALPTTTVPSALIATAALPGVLALGRNPSGWKHGFAPPVQLCACAPAAVNSRAGPMTAAARPARAAQASFTTLRRYSSPVILCLLYGHESSRPERFSGGL